MFFSTQVNNKFHRIKTNAVDVTRNNKNSSVNLKMILSFVILNEIIENSIILYKYVFRCLVYLLTDIDDTINLYFYVLAKINKIVS